MCLQLEDAVPMRFHWPLYCNLRVNEHQVRPYLRGNNIKLGINQRDEALDLLPFCQRGRGNQISISAMDKGSFVLLVCIARRRSMPQVKVRREGAGCLGIQQQLLVHTYQHIGDGVNVMYQPVTILCVFSFTLSGCVRDMPIHNLGVSGVMKGALLSMRR
jgi:hypothetical protein